MPNMQVYALINWAREIRKTNPDSAVLLCKESLLLNEKMNYKAGIIKSTITLGECYMGKKDYTAALSVFLSANEKYGKEISVTEKVHLLDRIYYTYKYQGNYKMAIETDEKWQALYDSLQSGKTSEALLRFSKKVDFLKAEKEAAVKQLKIVKQQNLIRTLVLGSIALGSIALLYFLYQRKKQAVKTKQIEFLQKENENIALKSSLRGQLDERSRISTEIHDELGSSLTTISLLTEVMKKRLDTSLNPELSKISDTSADMVDRMNEIVWALNTSNDTVKSLVAYVRKFANNFLQDASIELEFSEEIVVENQPLEGISRRNIYLTVKEAIHNIVKHSGAKKVHFDVNTLNGILIQIKDDGKGLDTGQSSSLGNGLKNMKKRMEDIGGTFNIENNNGTSIKISL